MTRRWASAIAGSATVEAERGHIQGHEDDPARPIRIVPSPAAVPISHPRSRPESVEPLVHVASLLVAALASTTGDRRNRRARYDGTMREVASQRRYGPAGRRAELVHAQYGAQLLPVHRRGFLRRREEQRALYRAFLASWAVRAGQVNINKTRISFQGRVRFAGVARGDQSGLTCVFWLKRADRSPRFTRVEASRRATTSHNFKLTDASQLDDEAAQGSEPRNRHAMNR